MDRPDTRGSTCRGIPHDAFIVMRDGRFARVCTPSGAYAVEHHVRPPLFVIALEYDGRLYGAHLLGFVYRGAGAVGADQILVDKASLVGSIGVIMEGFGFTGLMDTLDMTPFGILNLAWQGIAFPMN